MNPRSWFKSTYRMLQRSPAARAAVVAAAVSVIVIASVIGVLLGPDHGGTPSTPSPTPTASPVVSGCFIAATIEAPEGGGPDEWEELEPGLANECFRMSATDEENGVVGSSSEFVLESQERVEPEQLASQLLIEPPTAVTVSEDGIASSEGGRAATRYRISPAAPLQDDTVYRITVLDAPDGTPVRTWAFQTLKPLRVVQTLPADGTTAVPIDVGVELTFSHDGVTGVEEAFSIEPATDGKFETHKRTVVFVPKELTPATLYTVTLAPGIVGVEGTDQTLDEEVRFQFETGLEGRGDLDVPLQFAQRVWDSALSEPPAMTLFGGYSEKIEEDAELAFEVYQFPDLEAYEDALNEFSELPSWAYFARAWHTIDTSALELYSNFDVDLQTAGEFGDRYVIFPEALPEGHYLVSTQYRDQPLQALLQVTDISTYIAVSSARTIIWANDLATAEPLVGATITSPGMDFSQSTGGDGVTFFETPDGLIELTPSVYGYVTSRVVGNMIVTAPDGRRAVIPLADLFNGFRYFGYREYVFTGDASAYWRFLYTDRHLYRQNDAVKFWGFVRPRDGAAGPQEVVVEVSGWDYSAASGEYGPVTVARAEISSNELGAYMGELELRGVSPGFYTLQALIGDQTVISTYLEVQDFVTPAYDLKVTPSTSAAIEGDEVEFNIEASFFDGTPVPNVELDTSSYLLAGDGDGPRVVTGEDGQATLDYEAQYSATNDYSFYDYAYLSATPVQAEEAEITGSGTMQVFPSAVTLEANPRFEGTSGIIDGTVYNLDLSRLNGESASGPDDYLGTPSPNRTVSASVTEYSYRRIEIGERYDFINKIVRKEYRYETVTTSIGSFNATSGADGRFHIDFPAEAGRSYSVRLTVADDEGRSFRYSLYLYTGSGNYSYFQGPLIEADDPGPFAIGDTVSVTLRQGSDPLPTEDEPAYLFLLAQNGITEYALTEGPHYSFEFTEEHIPNTNVLGVRFAGGTYIEVSYPVSARFDYSVRELNVDVTPRQEGYEPGDDATVDIEVTDATGTPVAAEVLLSGIDEAVYRVQGASYFQDLAIMNVLYQPIQPGILETHASHMSGLPDSGAERGGDGGPRDNFKDTAVFERVTTDAEGRASMTFALPDNLTSWRITALAISDDLYAGSSVTLLPVGLPLFAEVTMNDTYLTTDEPNVRLRTFGESLSTGDSVTFTVEIPGLLDEPQAVNGEAFEPVDVALPDLSEGRYEMTVSVEAGGLEDSLVRKFTVVQSRLSRTENQFREVRPGDDVELEGSADGITEVVISDHNLGRYYPVLRSITWTYGDRVDQILARVLSGGLFATYFEAEPLPQPDYDVSTYQMDDGGIAILPFADSDLAISARIAALAPDEFGRQALLRYFTSVLDDDEETRERYVIALYGAAALGEPVLPQVRQLTGAEDLEPRERLYLGLAATELGDTDTALAVYRGLVEDFGERRGATARLRVNDDQDDIIEGTSLAAILGAALADENAPLFFEYTQRNYTTDILVELEQISFLVEVLPRLALAPTRVAYTHLGQRVERELERGDSDILRLTRDELDSLDLETMEGVAGVTTSFLVPVTADSIDVDGEISFDRTYAGQEGGSVTLTEGDYVRIQLSYHLPDTAAAGCYQVSDFLPSGLRPVVRASNLNLKDASATYVSPYSIEGQRVSFCVYKGSVQRPIVYYARVGSTGRYSAEAAIIQSQQVQESISLTDRLAVEIR